MISKLAIFSAMIGTVFSVQAEAETERYSAPSYGGYGGYGQAYATPAYGQSATPQYGAAPQYGAPQYGAGYGVQSSYGNPTYGSYGQPVAQTYQPSYTVPASPGYGQYGAGAYGAYGAPQYGTTTLPYGANPLATTISKTPEQESKYATCTLADPQGQTGVTGTIVFQQLEGEPMLISGKVSGLSEGLHGFHVHEFGNIRGSCKSTGGHFNPFNQDHGAYDAKVRHVGDFKQLEAGADGVADYYYVDGQATLMEGAANIIGRGLVVHAGEDDLGLGGDAGSLANGNAGARVACCVIGIDSAPADTTRKSRKSREMQWGDKVDLGVTWSTKVRAMKEDIEGALKMRLGKVTPTYKQTSNLNGWRHRIFIDTPQGSYAVTCEEDKRYRTGLRVTGVQKA